MNNEQYTLEQVLELVIDHRGKTPTKLKGRWSNEGIPALSAKNIKEGEIVNEDSIRFVDNDLYERWMPVKLDAGDILLTSEAPLGELLYLKSKTDYCLSQRLFGLRAKRTLLYPRFLYYNLLTREMQARLRARATGTTAQGIRQKELLKVIIDIPSFKIQRSIASILSAYDDLIENNKRHIKILEQMAQTIYDEWFVKFRFPSHSKVKMVDSELGKIPEGWEIRQVKELVEMFRGKSYRGSDLTDGEGKPFLNLKNIQRYGGYRGEGLKWYNGAYKESQVARPGDIVIAVTDMTQERMIVARAARVPIAEFEKYVFSMDLVKVQPKDEVNRGFLSGMFLYSSFGDEVKQYANGVNVLHLSPDRIAEYRFVTPPKTLRQQYSKIFDDTFSLADTLRAKNRNLAQTRDTLLPKFISGEIDVEDMDIHIGDVDDR